MDRELYIVDDSADHQFLMYNLLRGSASAYPVKFFESGHALYRHIKMLLQTGRQDFLPALILLDLNMPGMTGLGLLKRFRQAAQVNGTQIPGIPIVIMSGHITADQINQCYHAGANAVVFKPFDFNLMKDMVRAICRFYMDIKRDTDLSV